MRRAPATGARVDLEYARAYAAGLRAESAGDLEGARLAFGRAAEREPAPLGLAREALGNVLARRGEDALALRAFEDARRDPAAAEARGYLAERALAHGQIARADSLLTEALAYSDHDGRLLGLRARLFAREGRMEEAIRESERAVRRTPQDARLLVNHGSLLWEEGETGAAEYLWERATAMDRMAAALLSGVRNAIGDRPSPPLLPLFVGPDRRPLGFDEEPPPGEATDDAPPPSDARPPSTP
jgi:tetratricopeptide (TPR) repeat protein